MVQVLPRVRRALDNLPVSLLVVPVFLSLTKLDQLRAVTRFRGIHLGLRPSLPTAVVDLWTLVSIPGGSYESPARSTTGTITRYVETPIPIGTLTRNVGESDALLGSTVLVVVLALGLGVLVRAALTAGYLGSLQEYRQTGTYAFGANVRRYLRPFLLLELALLVLLALGGVLLLSSPAFFLLGLLAYLVGAYLFYGAPFLFVVEDCGFGAGLRQSYRLATGDSDYWYWGLSYFGVTLVISLVSTIFVVNLGLVGVLLGLTVLPAVGMALTMATLSFFDDKHGTGPRQAMDDTSPGESPDSL